MPTITREQGFQDDIFIPNTLQGKQILAKSRGLLAV